MRSPRHRRSNLEEALAQLVSRPLTHQKLAGLAVRTRRPVAPQAILLLAVTLLKVVTPVKVAALGVMAPLQELQVTPLYQVVAQVEVEAEIWAEQTPPLDQVVAHLEVFIHGTCGAFMAEGTSQLYQTLLEEKRVMFRGIACMFHIAHTCPPTLLP